MESYGLEMDELFDDRTVEEVMDESNPVENGEDGQEPGDGENNISRQVAEKLQQLGKGAAKKRVLKPQPKLDPERLIGERGIPILPKVFEKVKFKGKGHEVRDLNKMMNTMEHWAHRLFPKMPFDELIERVERLGQKRAVQSTVNKIRLDMPILNNDFVSQTQSDDEPHGHTDNTDIPDDVQEEMMQVADTNNDDEELLDEILSQEREDNSQSASTPYPKSRPSQSAEPTDTGLTPELMERIRRNQEEALRRRLQKT